ncbi:hypothetical protein HMI54_007299 [Coelomomyces lativittatus]|nr:hypothetical protein HMI54_007299 [Coelomomyces lativittatus]KAJ1516572.1 hypothetical protein HMI55_001947 [Coelomomyces lativittatus]
MYLPSCFVIICVSLSWAYLLQYVSANSSGQGNLVAQVEEPFMQAVVINRIRFLAPTSPNSRVQYKERLLLASPDFFFEFRKSASTQRFSCSVIAKFGCKVCKKTGQTLSDYLHVFSCNQDTHRGIGRASFMEGLFPGYTDLRQLQGERLVMSVNCFHPDTLRFLTWHIDFSIQVPP